MELFTYYIESLEYKGDGFIEKYASCVKLKDEGERDYFNLAFKAWVVSCVAQCFVFHDFPKIFFICDNKKTAFLFFYNLIRNDIMSKRFEVIRFSKKDIIKKYTNKYFLLLTDNISQVSARNRARLRIAMEYSGNHKRYASFCGGANSAARAKELMSDWRTFAFDVTELNWDIIKETNIDNLWAEAYYLFKNGYDYMKILKEKLHKK